MSCRKAKYCKIRIICGFETKTTLYVNPKKLDSKRKDHKGTTELKGITMAAAERHLLRKIKKEKIGSEDAINKLRDDILINILSRLTIKEAVKTSFFSSR